MLLNGGPRNRHKIQFRPLPTAICHRTRVHFHSLHRLHSRATTSYITLSAAIK